MKKLFLIIALCAGALQAHQSWEYKTIKIPTEVSGDATHGFIYTLNFAAFDARLNGFAAEGWQLVALASIATGHHGTNYVIATFKRPKE